MSDINSNSNILKEVVQVHDPVLLNTPQPCPNIPIQSIEEREKRLSDERVLIAQKLQRKQRLDALVRKRKANLEYLQKVHLGGCNWLNTTLLTTEDILRYLRQSNSSSSISSTFNSLLQIRSHNFLILSLSLSKILSNITSPLLFIKAILQLIEEWEYYTSSIAMQSMKFLMSKSIPNQFPHTLPLQDIYQEILKTNLLKYNNNIVYEYLIVSLNNSSLTSSSSSSSTNFTNSFGYNLNIGTNYGYNLNYEYDYIEVVYSLLEILVKVYEKFLDSSSNNFLNSILYESIIKFDGRVKHHVINLISKELTDLANSKSSNELYKLRLWSDFKNSLPPVTISHNNNSNNSNSSNTSSNSSYILSSIHTGKPNNIK